MDRPEPGTAPEVSQFRGSPIRLHADHTGSSGAADGDQQRQQEEERQAAAGRHTDRRHVRPEHVTLRHVMERRHTLILIHIRSL